jgi:hypothetical protein
MVGEEHLNIDAILHVGLVNQQICLGEEPAGVYGEYARLVVNACHHVGQHLVLESHARRQCYAIAESAQ